MDGKNLTNLSKYLSLILRHKPETIGISLDKHGWADVDELIAGISKTKDFNMEILEEIVRIDEKQRYSFNADKTKIRANQGHSIDVDVELEEKIPPEVLYHGTATRFIESIKKNGINKQSRLYVHLSKDIDTAFMVGKRHGRPAIFVVDTKAMVADGYKFYLSENGVWLTDVVPNKYLRKEVIYSMVDFYALYESDIKTNEDKLNLLKVRRNQINREMKECLGDIERLPLKTELKSVERMISKYENQLNDIEEERE